MTYRSIYHPPGVSFPAPGETVWTTEVEGDARSPVPDIGHAGLIEIECGTTRRLYRAVVDHYGRLIAQPGSNSWYVAWRLLADAQYRIEVKDDGRWVPAPGESTGLTREMAEQMVGAGIPTMDGSEPEWDDVRIVEER